MRLPSVLTLGAVLPEPARAAGVRRHGRRLLLVRGGWLALAGLSAGMFLAGIRAEFAQLQLACAAASCPPDQLPPTGVQALRDLGLSLRFYATYAVAMDVVVAAVYGAVAALIFWRRAADRLAPFASLALLTFGTASFPSAVDWLAAAHPAWHLPVAGLLSLGAASFSLFLYLFPDGRFVPRWTRWVALAWIAWQLPRHWFPGWRAALMTDPWPVWVEAVVWTSALGTAVYAQVYRYRRVSTPAQRQQTKWVVLGIAAALLGYRGVGLALAVFAPAPTSAGRLAALLAGFALIYLAMLCIPVSIGIAMLRHHLFDVDLLINRALVYGALTASILGLYGLIVGGAGALFQSRGAAGVAVPATVVVAVLVQPLRRRLQRGVNRLLYGQRDEPYTVLAGLGRRLEATLAPDAVLPAIVETVAQALKLPHAAIALGQGEASVPAASYGTPAGEPLALPLVYQGETVGQLVLSPRAPGEGWTAADRRLLDDLAHQAGVAAHAVCLTADLRRSRERLVAAREEERRRLRRDLHDGLGPQLAGVALRLDLVHTLLRHDPDAAEALVLELKARTQAAVADIRGLVYALRPPALDELGLVAALRQQAALDLHHGPHITIDAPEPLPALPAAVEVAAYRIAREAMTNVVRHARARTCAVRLALDAEAGALRLEISDDGVGVPAIRHVGVGLLSMRERAEELGGSCVVAPRPAGGTCVLVRLPADAGGGHAGGADARPHGLLPVREQGAAARGHPGGADARPGGQRQEE